MYTVKSSKVVALLVIFSFILTNNVYPAQFAYKDTLRPALQGDGDMLSGSTAAANGQPRQTRSLASNETTPGMSRMQFVKLTGLGLAGLPFTVGCSRAQEPVPSAERGAPSQTIISIPEDSRARITQAADWLISMRHPETKLPPSHVGHKGLEDTYYLYDLAHNAIELAIAGKQREAEEMLDYIMARLNIPIEEARRRADVRGVWGILQVFSDPFGYGLFVKGVLNAIDITNTARQGRAKEFWTTPGPIAWTILAMLQVNPGKYIKGAEMLAEVLLALQDKEGGIVDGTRSFRNINVEPHMDGYAGFKVFIDIYRAFSNLYEATRNTKYREAARRSFDWFFNKAVNRERGTILQGILDGNRSTIHATDVYTWPIAMAADRLEPDLILRLVKTVEERSLVDVTYTKADGNKVSVILPDFTDPEDGQVRGMRGGYHPMGSTEWAGGMVLMYYEAACRLWDEGYQEEARTLKAKGDALLHHTWQTGVMRDGKISGPYATSKWLAVGHGWNTPIGDESAAWDWIILPTAKFNPFLYKGGNLSERLSRIPSLRLEEGLALLKQAVKHPSYTEQPRRDFPEEATEQATVTPTAFMERAWEAYNRENLNEAIKWAASTVDNWLEQAREENAIKQKRIGGLIDYPWGSRNEELEEAIWKYPLLNEVGAACWVAAASHFRQGNKGEAKRYMRIIITQLPLHQIYDPNAPGFWNAIKSWILTPSSLDSQMAQIYEEICREEKIPTGAPQELSLPEGERAPARPAPAKPAPQREPAKPQPRPETPQQGVTIASGIDGSWSGSGAHSCWKLGPFNLSDAEYIEIAFPTASNGTNVFVRLLPEGATPDSSTGLNRKMYTVRDGRIRIPISEFPVSASQLRNIDQISVHSGSNAWNIRLNQGEDRTADFTTIRKIARAQTRGFLIPPGPENLPYVGLPGLYSRDPVRLAL